MTEVLPPVVPSVTAELVAALSPRLSKRLDSGVAKLAGLPVFRDGETARIALDDSTFVALHAPDGTVRTADAIRCGCLLAPACLHRAAVASAAPIADVAPEAAPGSEAHPDPRPGPDPGPASDLGSRSGSGQEAARRPKAAPGPDAASGAEAAPGPDAGTPHLTSTGGSADTTPPVPGTATARQCDAARAVYDATAAVLEAGVEGCGAVLQAELLRAAHTARLAGLPRPSASAISVVTGVRAARAADPAHRLDDLVSVLRDTLAVTHRVPLACGPELAALRGTVRQPYTPDGSLRLYGLFCEPVLTTTGYAGAVTWTADAEGRLYTASDVAPGGVGRAVGAADRSVRVGDTALTHRELSRAGLAVSGATVSPTGRLGAGATVGAVRASGAAWSEPPLDRLWAEPVSDQVTRALDREGHGLLFLKVTLTGTAREAAGDVLLADCDGLTLRLAAAHDDPGLPHRANLRLLATAQGSRLRIVARLSPAAHPRALLLATGHPLDPADRVDLGLDRLQQADLPATAVPAGPPAPPAADEAPVHLLRRRVRQAASGGRRVLALPGGGAADGRRLGRHGLATAAELLEELHASAADRSRDPFGRLLAANAGRFARAWLACARYTEEVDRTLCAAAWRSTA